MNIMNFCIVLFVVAMLASRADAAVVFSAPSGATHTVTTDINEGVTSGTAYTVVAAGTGTVTYAISAQTKSGSFIIDSSSGAISVASTASIDYEQYSSHVLTVTGADSTATGTVTITVNIADVNDNTPTFNCASMSTSVVDAAAASTDIGTFPANDQDGTTANNALTYSIASGNTGTVFALSSTGALSVATSKTTAMGTTPCFTLVLQAVDSGTTARTGSATLVVSVGGSNCSGAAAALIGSMVVLLASVLMHLIQ